MKKWILATAIIGGAITLQAFVAAKKTSDKRTQYFDVSGMDKNVKPGEDFFLYANGAWVRDAKIPDDKSQWGSFVLLAQQNKAHLHDILVDVSSKTTWAKGSNEQKLGDFYASGMDTLQIEKLGWSPIASELKRIDALNSADDIIHYCADGFKEGNGDMIGFWVGPDDKNSNMNVAALGQTGTTLPEKDYYLSNEADKKSIREAYVAYITKLFVLTGNSEAKAKHMAEDILALETEIAKTHRSAIELRDPQANYNMMKFTELQALSPDMDWSDIFRRMGVKVDSLNVAQPDYYKQLGTMFNRYSVNVWKSKLKFDFINGAASLLSKDFRDASFAFKGKRLSGQKVQEIRWKQVTDATDRSLGELLGQLYVAKYFTPESKKRMDELVNNLQKAFANRIDHLDWMSADTKVKARTKLFAITKKIGYPDKWKNYDDVTITRGDYFGNMQSVSVHGWNEMVKKLGKAVDKSEWGMTPATVNAYYNPSFNEIVFPAGILQFPFFDPNADDAINYGAIGMVIGHEMTHGFDDQGAQYDAAGNMNNWWTEEDMKKFEAKTSNLVAQYDGYTILDSVHVKGALTLGENIADLGGVAIAYDAFKMTKQGQSNQTIDGFTPDQRFFLGLAQVWRVVRREQSMRMMVNVDPHSPAHFRINGPLSNFEPFYKAWGIHAGDKMYRDEATRTKIW